MATFMLLRDNHTLANELDLVRDHDLIKRVHQYGIMSPMNPVKNNEDYAQYYTWEGQHDPEAQGLGLVDHGHGPASARSHRMAVGTRDSGEISRRYGRDIPRWLPDTIYNGLWEYAPDFQERSAVAGRRGRDEHRQQRRRPHGSGRWHGHHRMAHEECPINSSAAPLLPQATDMLSRLVSSTRKTGGRPFTRRWQRWPSLTASSKAAPPTRSEYWLRCTLTGKASLERRQHPERYPDGAAGHAVDDRGRQPFHVLGAHGQQDRRQRRQASEDHAHLGRKVEDAPAKAPESPVYPAHGGTERRHGRGVPVERRHGP